MINLKTMAAWVLVGALFAVASVWTGPAAAQERFSHHVVFHVDENDAGKMNLAMNNAANVVKYYEEQGERVQVEIVTYGPGLMMLRADKSPVKSRMESYTMEYPDVSFAACANTMAAMERNEGMKPMLIESDSIHVVPSGVVQIMKRQDMGWHYIRP